MLTSHKSKLMFAHGLKFFPDIVGVPGMPAVHPLVELVVIQPVLASNREQLLGRVFDEPFKLGNLYGGGCWRA